MGFDGVDSPVTMDSKEVTPYDSSLRKLEDGTVVRHVYQTGKYQGEKVTETVKGDRIDVSGDPGPDGRDYTTRTPSGAAREADQRFRGEDARKHENSYSGWFWWEYRNDEGEWVPIDEIRR